MPGRTAGRTPDGPPCPSLALRSLLCSQLLFWGEISRNWARQPPAALAGVAGAPCWAPAPGGGVCVNVPAGSQPSLHGTRRFSTHFWWTERKNGVRSCMLLLAQQDWWRHRAEGTQGR